MKIQFTFILLLLLALSAAAQPGALDAGFGNNGYAAFNSAAFIDVGRAIVQQPDGRLLATGYYRNYPEAPRYLAVRFTASGQRDLSFGNGGMAEMDIIGEASGLALQADGKIVIAGSHTFTNPSNFTAVRLLPDGTPDPSFGVNGVATIGLNVSAASCRAMALQSDGKIVLAGHIENGGDTDVFLLRLNTDGALDASFGNGGRVQIPLMPYNQIFAMQIQPDGKILLGGSAGVPDVSDWLLLRLLPDGTPDPSFGQSGVVITSMSGSFAPEYLNGLSLQPDGKIVAAGAFFDEFEYTLRVALARYLPDGALDMSFGQGGKVLPAIPGFGSQLNGVAMQPDGKILAAGFTNPDFEDANLLLLRFQPDGSFDNGFGNGGIVESGMPAEAEYGSALILQSDNKITVAGSIFDTEGEEQVLLARFESGLQPVSTRQAEESKLWIVFPNPCRDILTVRPAGSSPPQPVQVRLFDMAGRMVLSEKLEGRAGLSLRHLPAGVYGLHLVDEQGQVWRERVVKVVGR